MNLFVPIWMSNPGTFLFAWLTFIQNSLIFSLKFEKTPCIQINNLIGKKMKLSLQMLSVGCVNLVFMFRLDF